MRRRLMALVPLCLLFALFAPSLAVAGNTNGATGFSGSNTARAPYAQRPASKLGSLAGAGSEMALKSASFAARGAAASASDAVAVGLATARQFYFFDHPADADAPDYTLVCIFGSVTNNTGATVDSPEFDYQVRSNGVVVESNWNFCDAYQLADGKSASFFEILAVDGLIATKTNDVVVTTQGYPAGGDAPVTLTQVGISTVVTDAYGVRHYSVAFRNDSASAVTVPILGGWERTATAERNGSDILDTLWAHGDYNRVEPGATWTTAEPEGGIIGGGITVNSVETYAQALPVLAPKYMPVYRFYNKKNGSHFYTADEAEKASTLKNLHKTYQLDGVAYQVNTANYGNSSPLYRFYNKKNGSHFYTASEEEAYKVKQTMSATYSYDGPAYGVCTLPPTGSTAVYRFYNKKNGSHFYTASEAEKASVQKNLSKTYSLDGPAFFLAP